MRGVSRSLSPTGELAVETVINMAEKTRPTNKAKEHFKHKPYELFDFKNKTQQVEE